MHVYFQFLKQLFIIDIVITVIIIIIIPYNICEKMAHTQNQSYLILCNMIKWKEIVMYKNLFKYQ